MSDKSAEETVEVMDRFQRGLSIIPPLAVTGAWRVFSLESITEIYTAGKRAGMESAAEIADLARRSVMAGDGPERTAAAIQQAILTAAGKVGT